MHSVELIVFAFSPSLTNFLQKINIVCGVWTPATPAFRMYAQVFHLHEGGLKKCYRIPLEQRLFPKPSVRSTPCHDSLMHFFSFWKF